MPGLRDLGLLESSIAQPHQSFGGVDLYPGLNAKAAALGFSLIQNHPFVDGNKRIGHAAMETTLVLNGVELTATIDAAEAVVLAVYKLLFDNAGNHLQYCTGIKDHCACL